jgi:predicted RNA polymerase sigma factor
VSSRSDEALLLAARRDADAFAELYRRHARPLAGFLFDPARGDAVGWLYGIARHQLGRRARRGSVEERARRRLGMERLELTDSDLRAIEACDDATVALQSLPPEQRDAITARVIAEQDYAAIADAAGASEPAVRQLPAARARTALSPPHSPATPWPPWCRRGQRWQSSTARASPASPATRRRCSSATAGASGP